MIVNASLKGVFLAQEVAGLSDHAWELDELIALMPKPVARPCSGVKRAKAMADAPLARTSADVKEDGAARR